MKAGNLVRYTEDIHDDIGVVIKVLHYVAIVRWVDDLSVDYFCDVEWDLLEVIV
jgi:hypothetical protein